MKLLPENDPFLKIPTLEMDINNLPSDFNEVVDSMISLMYDENAIGLAANQIGLDWRLFVFLTSDGPQVCINPKINKVGDTKPTREGCLSFPNLKLVINRPNFIQVSFVDRELVNKTIFLSDINAVCFQHELAHLDGRLFIDEVSSFQLKRAYEKREKLLRKEQKSSLKR